VHRPPSMADCPSKVENKLLAKKNSQVLHQHQKRHEQTSAIHFACQVDQSERATRTVAFILWLSFRFCPQHVRASLLSAPNRCAVVRDPGCWPHHIGTLAHWPIGPLAHWPIGTLYSVSTTNIVKGLHSCRIMWGLHFLRSSSMFQSKRLSLACLRGPSATCNNVLVAWLEVPFRHSIMGEMEILRTYCNSRS